MNAADESVARFDHVRVAFDDVVALDDVSFDIRRGETRIVVGAAGSGKSVMLKTILGLIKPALGRVWLFGQDVTDWKEEQLFDIRARMGVLFQEGGLFDSFTVEENVAYPIVTRAIPEHAEHNGTRRVRAHDECARGPAAQRVIGKARNRGAVA